MQNENLAWRIEDVCFKAWPALEEKNINGWRLRFSNGISRRTNSANPLRGAWQNTDGLIATCEAEYRQRHLPVYFRIPSIIGPDMPQQLAKAGYEIEGESLVLYKEIDRTQVATDDRVTVTTHATEEWLSAISHMRKYDAPGDATYRRIVSMIKSPTVFAALRHENQIVSLAFGVIHDQLLCFESVLTDESFRGRGFARHVIHALINHAHPHIQGLCLQVQSANQPAVRLYNGFGMRELYGYHYQRKL